MARKRIRVSRRMLFTWCMLGGFILLFTPHTLTGKFQLAFTHAFSRPLRIGRGISLAMRTPTRADTVSRREHTKLQNHAANLMEQLRQEQKKTQQLSGLRTRFGLEGACLVTADIITASEDRRNELVINRGQNDSLRADQFVISDNGIIGTISEVSAYRARVRLITDPAFRIAVKIAQLDVERLMRGAGNGRAKILQLQRKHKVQNGQSVYASKKPGFLDTPMIIGKVAQCKRDDENPTLWDITVEPVSDLERLVSVAVIVMNPQQN